MRASYPFRDIETRWQRVWNERTTEVAAAKERAYVFSWPVPVAPQGGDDVSFLRRSAVADTVSRFWRHQGVEPFLPLAADGFQPEVLAAATESGKPPQVIVLEEMGRIEAIARSIGCRHAVPPVSTSEAATYRLTQWIFLQLHAKGLVFRSEAERVVCGRCRRRYRPGTPGQPSQDTTSCPRCGGNLEERKVAEWRLDLRPYGDRLVSDLERIDLPECIRSTQRALIGRCRGSEVVFPVSRPFELEYQDLTMFTTRVEMIFGVTFLLVDPEHPILEHVLDPAYEEEVTRYRERLRKGAEPAISAARTGGFALNPANLKRIPILVSPLANKPHSEGAVMAVPAHDAELFVLAKRLKLAIREVIHNDKARFDSHTRLEEPWLGDGVMTNSGSFTSLPSKVGRDRIISFLARRGVCRRANRFLLRSIGLSTESPWGPPVPLVHCKRCGVVPVPDVDLPIPVSAAGAALDPGRIDGPAASRDLSRTPCPQCGQTGTRDRETIRPWLGRAWSFLRLMLPDLAGPIPGFREMGAPAGQVAAGEPGTAGGQGGVAAEEGPAGGGPERAEEPPVVAPLPEDVDIFAPGKEELPGGTDTPSPPDPGIGEGPEDAGGSFGADDAADQPPARADSPEIPAGEPPPAEEPAGAGPAAPEEEGPPTGEPTLTERPGEPAPPGARTPREARGERRGRGRRGEGGDQDGGRGQGRRSPADEPETIVLKDVEEEEIDDLGPRPSPLRPFRSAEAAGLLPAALALGPAELDAIDLIGARFLAKFLKDLGHIPVDEPFAKYRPVAGLLAKAPGPARTDEVAGLLERFGADALRLHLLFAAPAEKRIPLEAVALLPLRRFLDRIWRQMVLRLEKGKFVSRRMLEEKHLLIHLVTRRVTSGKIHTAIAALMQFVRFLESPETAPEDMDAVAMRTFIILLSPFAPHLAEELWSRMGAGDDLAAEPWPVPSDELIHPPEREFLILVDGRVRDRMQQPSNLESEKLESRALQRDRIREIVGNRKVEKVVVVPQRLVNIVLGPA
jgi:leucyl-tRNA synthetase